MKTKLITAINALWKQQLSIDIIGSKNTTYCINKENGKSLNCLKTLQCSRTKPDECRRNTRNGSEAKETKFIWYWTEIRQCTRLHPITIYLHSRTRHKGETTACSKNTKINREIERGCPLFIIELIPNKYWAVAWVNNSIDRSKTKRQIKKRTRSKSKLAFEYSKSEPEKGDKNFDVNRKRAVSCRSAQVRVKRLSLFNFEYNIHKKQTLRSITVKRRKLFTRSFHYPTNLTDRI